MPSESTGPEVPLKLSTSRTIGPENTWLALFANRNLNIPLTRGPVVAHRAEIEIHVRRDLLEIQGDITKLELMCTSKGKGKHPKAEAVKKSYVFEKTGVQMSGRSRMLLSVAIAPRPITTSAQTSGSGTETTWRLLYQPTDILLF